MGGIVLPDQNVEGDGYWLAYYSDWSGMAVFSTEIEALRYAVENQMRCEFREWGDVRG